MFYPGGQSIEKSNKKKYILNTTCYHHIFLLFFLSLCFLHRKDVLSTVHPSIIVFDHPTQVGHRERDVRNEQMHQHQGLSRHRHFSCAVDLVAPSHRVWFVHPRSKIPSKIPFMTDILHPRGNDRQKGRFRAQYRDVAAITTMMLFGGAVLLQQRISIANENRTDSLAKSGFTEGAVLFSACFRPWILLDEGRSIDLRLRMVYFRANGEKTLRVSLKDYLPSAHLRTTINTVTKIIVCRIKNWVRRKKWNDGGGYFFSGACFFLSCNRCGLLLLVFDLVPFTEPEIRDETQEIEGRTLTSIYRGRETCRKANEVCQAVANILDKACVRNQSPRNKILKSVESLSLSHRDRSLIPNSLLLSFFTLCLSSLLFCLSICTLQIE